MMRTIIAAQDGLLELSGDGESERGWNITEGLGKGARASIQGRENPVRKHLL